MIYILLPVHNRLEETRKFVACLKMQNCRDYHLILVDDGCTDGTADYVGSEIGNLTVVQGNGNLWWAGSLEKARKHLFSLRGVQDEDVVLIANDDITFNKDFLDDILRDTKENRNAIILARCLDRNQGKVIDRGVVVDWKRLEFRQAENASEINVLSTRGLYMTVDVFRRAGRFHPILLPHYASDYAFTHQAYKRGIRLAVSDRAVVYGNMKTTGKHDIDYRANLAEFLSNLFLSRKSVYNRITWTKFIALSCSPRYIPANLFRIHSATILILGRWVFRRIQDFSLTGRVGFDRLFRRRIRIIVGAGGAGQKQWISTEKTQIDLTERQSWLKFFPPGTIDAIMAEHVLEHLTSEDAVCALRNCREFLRPGGYLRIAVPDGYFPDARYLEDVKPMGSGPGSEEHKVLYNYMSLKDLLRSTGYHVKLLEYWDQHGVFHYEPWDADDGLILRSKNHDPRNRDGNLRYTSLVMDAIRK